MLRWGQSSVEKVILQNVLARRGKKVNSESIVVTFFCPWLKVQDIYIEKPAQIKTWSIFTFWLLFLLFVLFSPFCRIIGRVRPVFRCWIEYLCPWPIVWGNAKVKFVFLRRMVRQTRHTLLIYALAGDSEGYHAFYKNMHFRHKSSIFIVFVVNYA